MDSQDNPAQARRQQRAILWLVVLGTALGIFLVGMLGTGIALAQGAHPETGTSHVRVDAVAR